MTILTIYFCGTSSTKFDDTNPLYWQGELIAHLAASTMSREFAEWVVIDGPGSDNLQADDFWTEFINYSYFSGATFGNGWEENVRHALHIIKGNFNWQRQKLTAKQYELLKAAGIPINDATASGHYLKTYDYGDRKVTQQQLQAQIVRTFRKDGVIPAKVNLVGWSRGGVSCHMLANAMFEDDELKHIPVNILAIDPVPGPGNFQPNKVTLKSNVKEYVGFYARNEHSKGFSCVIPKTDPKTSIHVYPIAGRHATLVGNAGADGVSGGRVAKEPGLIVRHFSECCLATWGTPLEKKLDLSGGQLLKYIGSIEESATLYQTMESTVYVVGTDTTDGERTVSYGNEGRKFSSIQGQPYNPTTGLASSWYEVLASSPLFDANKAYWSDTLASSEEQLFFTGVQVRSGDKLSVVTEGELTVDDTQTSGGQAGQSARQSDLLRIYVGYIQETLPAPTTDPELPDNVLDPSKGDFEFGVDIVIPAIEGFEAPYKVTVIWSTSAGGYFEDEQEVDTDKALSAFLIPREELELKGDKPVDVEVYYVVTKEGKPDHASADLCFKIAEPSMLIPRIEVNQGVMKIDGGAVEVYQARGGVFVSAGWRTQRGYNVARQQRRPEGGLGPFTFSCSNKDIASVDNEGYVTGLKNGAATIIVTDSRNDTATYRIEVSGCFNVYLAEGNYNLITAEQWCRRTGLVPLGTREFHKLAAKYGKSLPITRHTWTCIRLNHDAGWFYHAQMKSPSYFANTYNGAIVGAMAMKYH
ncbi:hypothetical protein G7009_18315 [Pseudomonas capeferrum]|uniref:Ig-like domain-containing protein n=1 Tax=Pseudomonas capeferrum TaxID=1495066 RepID=UPI0015E2E671|nr:Ig-like domain-containing protein [Pseudomonas capeferrum]MBA1203679.1 hypothetical protein [Pseudomonas capeferrum]